MVHQFSLKLSFHLKCYLGNSLSRLILISLLYYLKVLYYVVQISVLN